MLPARLATSLLVLHLASACALEDAPDGAPPDDLASTAQALNGDTWSTVDDYTSDVATDPNKGATAFGVAISPTTRKVIVVGSRTNGSLREWYVRGNPNGSTSWFANSTYALASGHSAEAYGAASDVLGYFYVVGAAFDAGNTEHWIVRRSIDDAQSWQTVLDVPNAGGQGDSLRGITLDGNGNVFISGIQFAGGIARETIMKGPNHGASGGWTTVYTATSQYVTNGLLELTGMCRGTVGGVAQLVATGHAATASGGTQGYVVSSSNGGATWTELTATAHDTHNDVPGCAIGDGQFAIATASSGTTSGRWDTDLFVTPQSIQADTITTSNNPATGAQDAVYIGSETRFYTVGTVATSTLLADWRVRFHDASTGTWLDSDDWQYTGLTAGASRARAAAFDAVRGLYVIGDTDDTNRHQHAIVRHRM